MPDRAEHVVNYKTILRSVIEQRPSGMGQRLSETLGKNRSFVSQIANPNYKIPVPYKHLDTIFKVCGFSTKQKDAFLQEYYLAHPKYATKEGDAVVLEQHERTIVLPKTGDKALDADIEKLVVGLVNDMVSVYNRFK